MKKIITAVFITAALLTVQFTSHAQYTAAKESRATVNIPAAPKQLNTVMAGPQSCSSPQKVYCDAIKNLEYVVCLPLNADLNAAKKITGNITFTNTDKDGAYYFTLTYSWKGTMVRQENAKLAPGTPLVVKFALNADPNYSGSINNVQVFVQSCTKLYDPK